MLLASFSSLHIVFLGLLLTKRHVALSCLFIKCSATIGTFYIASSLPESTLGLLIRLMVFFGCLAIPHLYHRPESLALRFPSVLIALFLLSDFLLDNSALLHELDLVFLDDSLIHGVELFSLALKHLLTDFLMRLDAVRVEGPPATSSTLH